MIIEVFSKNRIVQGLSYKKINKLFNTGAVVHYSANSVIVNEDQTLDAFYIMLTGTAQVFLPISLERPIQVNLTTKNPAGPTAF